MFLNEEKKKHCLTYIIIVGLNFEQLLKLIMVIYEIHGNDLYKNNYLVSKPEAKLRIS